MEREIDFKKVKDEVKKLVSEITEIPENDLSEEARFAEDLGVDSMMALEIVASIEKRYKVAIPEEEIPNIRSLKDVYKVLEKLLK